MYIRIGIYPIEAVFEEFITSEKKVIEIDGVKVKTNSARYITFRDKGIICVECGAIGQFFALEKDIHTEGDIYHFNLYGVNSNGHEVLMTKDHIIPKSKGGKNNISNYQTMCKNCNNKKGDNI